MDKLKTGDILLFNDDRPQGFFGGFASMIKWGTHSNYTHIAMVLKNPTFIHPHLRGTYVWESSWEGKPDPQDGEIKCGVQITPIQEIIDDYKSMGHIYVRTLECDESLLSDANLSKVHEVVYKKPYDIVPLHWVEALIQKDLSPQKTNRFWCSALIGYIYTKCGILKPDTDWSIMTPNHFSLDGEKLSFDNGAKLSETEYRTY